MAPLRFLCLHGLGSNADIFKSQLGPLITELERDNSAEFIFVDGPVAQPAGPGIAGVYDGPYLGYFRCDQLPPAHDSIAAAFHLIDGIVEDEGPFDGVLGFSHGATLATAFLLHHTATRPHDPPWGPFRCAVFIAGLAPFEESGRRIRAVERGAVFKLPSVHVAGQEDEVFEESLNLYRLCERDGAALVVHEKGHLVPRERVDLMAVARAIRGLESKIVMI
ncbi:serine hydrolase FSH [Lipomyces tetrasporus]|uniref:Serine hydrolase FSH n=1 Tax=Lipomyces tetrasporus TaxID=54092 RepID=A0AAD7QY82_9ASCO|nr:serine hydrolase FSH [Lipomyces tetrasporus]KAJ8103647.1 serine hydrolase FSH [Lipomyces tetrasporus]